MKTKITNYGIDDDYSKSFVGINKGDSENFENPDAVDEDDNVEKDDVNEYTVPKYDKSVNKKIKDVDIEEEQVDENNYYANGDDNDDGMYQLDEFLSLMESQEQNNIEPNVSTAVKLSAVEIKSVENKTEKKQPATNKAKLDNIDENIITEKNTGIRLIKSNFYSQLEIQTRLVNDYGKFYCLSALSRFANQLKTDSHTSWFTIGILGSKTETKCSAKGNNYVIWQMYDLNNLERGEQEVSLFLFGNSYKSHWKSSLYDVFVIIKPDFMDDYKSNNAPKMNSKYFADGKANVKTGKPIPKPTANKITISVKADTQLIPLGIAKDIGPCQSYKRKNTEGGSTEATQRCKNLVNLSQVQFCIYHCKQLNKSFGSSSASAGGGNGKSNGNRNGNGNGTHSGFIKQAEFKNKNPHTEYYTTAEPNKRVIQHPNNLKKFVSEANASGFTKFFEKNVKNERDSMFPLTKELPSEHTKFIKATDAEKRAKQIKLIKEEAILSLSYDQNESEALTSVSFKMHKASDKELMAKLDDRALDKEDIIKYRQEQVYTSTGHFASQQQTESQKEFKSLFNAKSLMVESLASISTNVTTQKLFELRNTHQLPGMLTYKSDKQLSTMQSHRDIVKHLKKTTKDGEPEENAKENVTAEDEAPPVRVNVNPKKTEINAKDFLKTHVSQLKVAKPTLSATPPKPVATVNKAKQNDFDDLQLFDEEGKVTVKKLMTPLSPSLPLLKSTQVKRKAAESSPQQQNYAEEKAKKLKLIEDLMSMKSKHAKDANDPEKNSHLKAYLNRLEEKESVENRLSSVRNQSVKVVTCNVCEYTTFKQSDMCKSKRHDIKHRMVLQRYFKCKNCNKRMFTLDKLCPVTACIQCGAEKFEQCGMKDDTASGKRLNDMVMSIDGNN